MNEKIREAFEEWEDKRDPHEYNFEFSRAHEALREAGSYVDASVEKAYEAGYKAAVDQMKETIPGYKQFGEYQKDCETINALISDNNRHADDVEKLEAKLEEAIIELEHARIFATTREKMHPTRIHLYDSFLEKLKSIKENEG